jgi:hypothetical protein
MVSKNSHWLLSFVDDTFAPGPHIANSAQSIWTAHHASRTLLLWILALTLTTGAVVKTLFGAPESSVRFDLLTVACVIGLLRFQKSTHAKWIQGALLMIGLAWHLSCCTVTITDIRSGNLLRADALECPSRNNSIDLLEQGIWYSLFPALALQIVNSFTSMEPTALGALVLVFLTSQVALVNICNLYCPKQTIQIVAWSSMTFLSSLCVSCCPTSQKIMLFKFFYVTISLNFHIRFLFLHVLFSISFLFVNSKKKSA